MKVTMGPYVGYIGPYQLANLLQYLGFSAQYCSKLGERWADTWLADFCEWIHAKRNRVVKVKIHKYDTWNLDHTLAIIILPLLKQLLATSHGSPLVENEDVPDELKLPNANTLEGEEAWERAEERWKWVLNEMIWAFTQIVDETEDELDMNPEETKAFYARLDRGTTLFGKYYRKLWD
jgi:hypothetical protein